LPISSDRPSILKRARPPRSRYDGFRTPLITVSEHATGMSWTRRRVTFSALVLGTVACGAAWLASILAAGPFGNVAAVMVMAFAIKLTWVTINFWNGVIGFATLRRSRPLDGVEAAPEGTAIELRVAVLMTICNEDTVPVVARLRAIKAGLDAGSGADRFDYFLFSDSSAAGIVAAEEQAVAVWQAELADRSRLVYRRRERNVGAQHGNLYDFASRFGAGYDVMIVLDADSLMTAAAILDLVRTMQANPRIGVLQSLNCGILMDSPFARIFEFGHRHAMRCGVPGAVWWQGNRGQYRGHNAAIRVDAYARHSSLAALPDPKSFGGVIFCPDQAESLLMHRAGYEIREVPVEHGSYEGVPPTLIDHTTRYDRWFQGNLQNLRLLAQPGLAPMDRYHLIAVAHRFVAWPAIVIFVGLAAWLTIAWPEGPVFPARSALGLIVSYGAIYFTPRFLGLLDSALTAPRRYGGIARLSAGGLADLVLTLLFLPIAMVTTTLFAIGLGFGRTLRWDTQRRDSYRLPWSVAARCLWPQTGAGLLLLAALGIGAPSAIAWFLPFLAGLLLSIPLAVATASPALNRLIRRWRLCALPEELDPPPELAAVIAFETANGR